MSIVLRRSGKTGIRFSFNVLVKKADVIKYMRQSGLIVCCLFISLLVLSKSFAFGKKFSSKDLPWAQAEILILSQHPYWLRLLHYPSHSPMVGLWRSEIQNPSFFLDPDGNVNPAAELRKTLEALFSPVESIPILMCDLDFFISVT